MMSLSTFLCRLLDMVTNSSVPFLHLLFRSFLVLPRCRMLHISTLCHASPGCMVYASPLFTHSQMRSLTRQQLAELQNEYNNKMKAPRKICIQFSDIIPSSSSNEGISDIWPPQLLPRVEQLISAVRNFIASTSAGRRTTWL